LAGVGRLSALAGKELVHA